ncbi:hypothetical protein B0H11DRAFT_2222618 [Mycena galericulata]|nr:hypothetical protein B0H11DRAFT_2222618 [Mycena galericulata]
MAAPTQALPPWLSYTTITLPQTTETSVVFLPLTYFGPSIPLDSDWTYGGLSSPVSTASTTSQLSVTSTTSAIPSTSSAATPSSTFSLPSSSSSSISFTSPTSPPSALPTTAASSSLLTRAQLIGVIIGSILGALVLFLLLLLLCIRIRHRRNGSDAATTATGTSGTRTRTKFTLLPTRRTRRRTRFTMLTPPVAGDADADADEVLDDWLMVGSPTSPGPQSPPAEPGRGAGEADPFLTRALALAGGAVVERLPNPHSANNSGSGSAGNGNGNGNSTNSGSGSGSSRGTHATTSSGTNVSGYGVLLAHPTLSLPDREALGLPPGAASPSSPASAAYNNGSGNGGTGASALPRRILTPAQMAVLVEEDDMERVLPRASGSGERLGRGLGGVLEGEEGEEGELEEGVDEGEEGEGEVVHARRVALAGGKGKEKEKETEARRSWIPRFSWLLNRDSWRNSRGSHNSRGSRGSRDVEEEGGLLLFDAGAGGHSPTGSISETPASPVGAQGAGAGGSGVGASGSGVGASASASASGSGAATMREFGARPLLPFLARRPSAANNTVSRPISGVSALSSDGTGGSGSGRSGGTVFTDARETLSTRGSRAALGGGSSAQGSAVALGQGQAQAQGQGQGQMLDPLDLPAPAPLAAFASSSQHSLHHAASVRSQASLAHSLHGSASHSTSAASASLSHSTSQQGATLVGSASNTTLGTVATPATGHAPLKPERVYAHGQAPAYPHAPPGLGYPYAYSGTTTNSGNTVRSTNTGGQGQGQGQGQGWDAAGLELGFARPASHSKLGTFGSKNAAVVPAAFGAPGIRVVGAPASAGSLGGGGGSGGGAPHLSLDLDDAPPGAEGGWRLLGGSAHSLLGSQSSREGDRDGGPGRRGTFGIGVTGAAQYHHSPEHSSERGSLHSRVGGSSSINSSSLSSRSHGHAQLPSGATTSHSLYPSSGSGSHSHSHSGNSHSNSSARARALAHAGSVEGPMSPAVSAFGHRARGAGAENSGSSGSGGPRHGKQETSSGSGERSRSPRSPTSPLLAPWAGGLDPDWRPT